MKQFNEPIGLLVQSCSSANESGQSTILFRPWGWSLRITHSFSLELTLPGLQLQFVLHRDQENSQRRSLKGTKRRCQATTRVTNGFVLLQCCQGAHITIILRIPRPQFIAITHLPSVPIERRGIYSKHTHTIFVVHWQQSPKFLAGRRNQSIVETP